MMPQLSSTANMQLVSSNDAAIINEHLFVSNCDDQLIDFSDTELDDISDSGSEYIPSDLEENKCCLCDNEVFIRCYVSDCAEQLCFNHMGTTCQEHKKEQSREHRLSKKIQSLQMSSSDSDVDTPVGKHKISNEASNQAAVPISSDLECQVASRSEGKKSRKRTRNGNKWHRVQSKVMREHGKEYISSRGRKVPAKVVPDGFLCKNKCRRHCSTKIAESERQQIFDAFYEMDGESQNAYLFKSIEPVKPQMQRLNAERHRQLSFHYRVTVNGNATYICKAAFISLHQITKAKLNHLIQQINSGASAPHPSLRGRHSNRPNKTDEKKQSW